MVRASGGGFTILPGPRAVDVRDYMVAVMRDYNNNNMYMCMHMCM